MKKICRAVIISFIFAGCAFFHQNMKSVKFHVVAGRVPPDSRIFVTGDGELGGWKADGIPLNHQSDGSWAITVMLPKGKSFNFKITRGKWRTEALDERGPQLRAVRWFAVAHDTTINLEFSRWMDLDGGTTRISAKDIESNGGFELDYGWRFHSGDDSSWAVAAFDDSSWEIIRSHLDADNMPKGGWTGTAWFRLNLDIDSSLWNKPLAINFRQAGASEVFLDGEPLYSVGDVRHYFGESPAEYLRGKRYSQSRNPNILSFSSTRRHVIAVRYGSHSELPAYAIRFGLFNGFHIWIENWNNSISTARENEVRQIAFAAIVGALAFIHFIIFVFYPKFRENLFYSISTAGVEGVWLANNFAAYVVSEKQLILLNDISQVSQFVALVFGILLVYSLTCKKFPKRWKIYAVAGAVLALWSVIYETKLYFDLNNLFTLTVATEMAWMVITTRGKDHVVTNVLRSGFFIFAVTIIYGILVQYFGLPPVNEQNDEYIYGVVALGVAMSVSLSRRFARTNRDLEIQLRQVSELSDRTLAQEREAHEMEMERRLLAADNERKTNELEDARSLQLSMLPKEVPNLPNLDIAVYMKTATEVGGDYYDFNVGHDGTLTVALGDATGHGAKAGMMVLISKYMFHDLARKNSLVEIFEEYTASIKRLNMHSIYMAMLLLRIKDDKVTVASAGIPAPLIYRAAKHEIEEVALKGMPLGGFTKFPYQQKDLQLCAGDAIVLMTDGLPEMFNDKNETFGYERVKHALCEAAGMSPQGIVNHLSERGETWANGNPLQDDVTFVVIKVK